MHTFTANGPTDTVAPNPSHAMQCHRAASGSASRAESLLVVLDSLTLSLSVAQLERRRMSHGTPLATDSATLLDIRFDH